MSCCELSNPLPIRKLVHHVVAELEDSPRGFSDTRHGGLYGTLREVVVDRGRFINYPEERWPYEHSQAPVQNSSARNLWQVKLRDGKIL